MIGEVVVWQDYVCPWAYLGRHRTALIEALGIVVVRQPFELHPESPHSARPLRRGGRLAGVLERIGSECDELGIAFRAPTTTPNTRMVLEVAEVVRTHDPEHFAAFDDALFEARFVHDVDLNDPEQVERIMGELGIDTALLDGSRRETGRDLVEHSIRTARESGITATPSWLFPNGFVITGVHHPDQVRRWVNRIVQRSEGVGRIVGDG